jgi:hypothetical protein
MSQFPMFQRFFLLQSSPVLDNIFCRIQIPMLQIPAELFSFSYATVSHTLLCISRMWDSLFALFFGQRNRKVLLRERQKKTRFKLPLSRERELLILIWTMKRWFNFAPKEKRNFIMNSTTIVSTTDPTGRCA